MRPSPMSSNFSEHETNIARECELHLTRRQLFGRLSKGIGVAALASLVSEDLFAGVAQAVVQHIAKAKRVIFLHQSGGPSQIDTFDYKPALRKAQGTDLPDSVRM